jgi:hypothetical protein
MFEKNHKTQFDERRKQDITKGLKTQPVLDTYQQLQTQMDTRRSELDSHTLLRNTNQQERGTQVAHLTDF